MFILQCACGNEIYGDEEDQCDFWQCESCGCWYDYFGTQINAPKVSAVFKDYDADCASEDG